MEWLDSQNCSHYYVGFGVDLGHDIENETVINSKVAISLQDCKGNELDHFLINGTGVQLYNQKNPTSCGVTQKFDVSNAVSGEIFRQEIFDKILNYSTLENKSIYFSELGGKHYDDCTASILEVEPNVEWLRNFTNACCQIYVGPILERFNNCLNLTKNWNYTDDVLGLARESAFETLLWQSNCDSPPAIPNSQSSSINNAAMTEGLIFMGVLLACSYVVAVAMYIKKTSSPYEQI